MFMLSNMVQKLIEKIEDKEKRGPFYKPKILINIYNKTDFLLLSNRASISDLFDVMTRENLYLDFHVLSANTHLHDILGCSQR